MRITKRKLVPVSALALLVIASALWVSSDSFRIRHHLRALRYAEKRMFAPQSSTFRQQLMAFVLRKPDGQGWAARCARHEKALLRLGYFAQREFPVTNQHILGVQLVTNAQQRFATQFSSLKLVASGQPLDGGTVASNSFIAVIAPAAEMSNWSKLISELNGGRL